MKFRRTLIVASLVIPLALGACGQSAEQPSQNSAAGQGASVTVSAARNSIAFSLTLLRTVRPKVRPAALLSIYTSMFLADGSDVPVTAAMDGISAQILLHALPTGENVDTLYSLLDEFGAVLHVNVPDLLNRSDDRAKTLDAYITGLSNITERSTRRTADVKEQIASLKATQREQKTTISGLNREVKTAINDKDFATAQERQKDLTAAQTALVQTESQLTELQSIQRTFEDLLDIAEGRLSALNGNREILIAGLRVVDVPGVEDLGVIQGKTNARKRSGGSFFEGL